MRWSLVRSFLLLSLVAGCSAETDLAADRAFFVIEPGSPEEAGVLAFVNDASTTLTVLDDDVPLDRRAAENIVARRDGADGIVGTSDDAPFVSADDLDSVAWVGPAALDALLAFARDGGWIDAAAPDRDAAIVALVNDPATTFAILDVDVGLDRRAAENLVSHRDGPDAVAGTADDRSFASVAEIDAIPYVGPVALDDLAAYALAHGYGGSLPPPSRPCAIISEVVEGSGSYNKAVELYNCGTEPLALEDLGFCLVRNGETSCSITTGVGAGPLDAGDVWTICRSRADALSDPFPQLVAACDHEVGTAASFNGDDRLVVFADLDRDGALGDGELLDVFGEMAVQPPDTIWSDAAFRRCDPTPHTTGPFDLEGTFLIARLGEASIYDHLGVPPSSDCAPPVLGSEGDDCLETAACESGLRCMGIPSDGSTPYGKCVDTTPLPGEGDRCDRWAPCADGLICAGWTLWGEGNCVAEWMAGRYEAVGPAPIHDPPSGGIAPSVVVYGLASVPVDIEVVAEIDHPRPSDLRVTLMDPNGAEAVLWDRSTELGATNRSFVTTGGISRDDQVNGRWHLRFEDLVSGQTGVFERWSLFVVSRWD